MNVEGLFELAKPYLEKNDFGMSHTQRVFDIARANFKVPSELQELTFYSIILHDIGGGSIKDQYEKGPGIAASLLKQMGSDESFVQQVCEIVGTHHDHPKNPSFEYFMIRISWLCFLQKNFIITILAQVSIGTKLWI